MKSTQQGYNYASIKLEDWNKPATISYERGYFYGINRIFDIYIVGKNYVSTNKNRKLFKLHHGKWWRIGQVIPMLVLLVE